MRSRPRCTPLPPCSDALGRGAVRCLIWAGGSTLAFSHTLSLSRAFSLSLSRLLARWLSLARTLARYLSPLSLSLSLARSLARLLARSLSLSLSKLQPRNINVSFNNNSNVPIDVIIFTFYSDQLTIDVETGIVTK